MDNTKQILTQDYLKSILDYNPETGIFKWKYRTNVNQRVNTRYAGKVSGYLNVDNYVIIRINGINYKAHRLAYIIHYGIIPNIIDHYNGDESDNRIINLINTDQTNNMHNRKKPKTNSSGHVGVYFVEKSKVWIASICINYKTIHLGQYGHKEEALKARADADMKYKFNPNHGR